MHSFFLRSEGVLVLVSNRITTLGRETRRATRRTLEVSACPLFDIDFLPQLPTVATLWRTPQSSNFSFHTFNYGRAHTLTNLANSNSQSLTWLILTNSIAGTDVSLTSTASVPGSGWPVAMAGIPCSAQDGGGDTGRPRQILTDRNQQPQVWLA